MNCTNPECNTPGAPSEMINGLCHACTAKELGKARAAMINTIELERYLVDMLAKHYCDGHKEFCICWTCTAKRDIERDLDRLQALIETAP